jgi:hypothetical protein
MNIEGMRKVLQTMTEDQLRLVNRMVVDQIREAQRRKARSLLVNLSTGQKVWFYDKRGRKITMEIDRINEKTVSGREILPDGERGFVTWRVHPSLLHAA